MNDYELALQNIKDALDMLHRHISDGTFNHPYWSISKIQELIDKDKKYAWHDLRKNPNDLPKTNGFSYIPCLICTESSPAEYAEYEYFEGYGWGFYGFNFESIKAWRYIEPFEVTE